MNRLLPLLFGSLILSACGQSNGSSSTGSGRPDLPTGVEVRFPAAPANAYLSLLTEGGQSVYQLSVPTGSTSIAVDPTKWAAQSSAAVLPENLLPAGASSTPANTKIALLHWAMWQDTNQNGTLDSGEQLDLMTHDRVAYASQAFTADFTANEIHERWNLRQGWSRAAHYVYRPKNATVFERLFESNTLERYELHVPTPLNSQ